MYETTNKETKKNEVALQRKANTYINKYNNAMSGCEKSAWNLCKVVFETVNAPDFADVFGTMSNYAKALDVSKASLSKYYKAYERRKLLIEQNEENTNFSVTQVAEFSPISMSETKDFVTFEEVTTEDTALEIREKAKHYISHFYPPVYEETTEETDTEETEETIDCDCMVVIYNGEEIQVLNEDKIKAIKELLEIE